MAKKKFSWKILLTKLGKNVLYIFIAGLAATYGGNPLYLTIAPVISAIENYVKNR